MARRGPGEARRATWGTEALSSRPQADLLLELLGEVRALRGEVQELRSEIRAPRRPGFSTEDRALVRAIFGAVGPRPFTAAEILDYLRPPELKGAGAICAALRAAIEVPNSRRLGKLLKRIHGLDVDGLQVVREGEDREGASWSVRECGS